MADLHIRFGNTGGNSHIVRFYFRQDNGTVYDWNYGDPRCRDSIITITNHPLTPHESTLPGQNGQPAPISYTPTVIDLNQSNDAGRTYVALENGFTTDFIKDGDVIFKLTATFTSASNYSLTIYDANNVPLAIFDQYKFNDRGGVGMMNGASGVLQGDLCDGATPDNSDRFEPNIYAQYETYKRNDGYIAAECSIFYSYDARYNRYVSRSDYHNYSLDAPVLIKDDSTQKWTVTEYYKGGWTQELADSEGNIVVAQVVCENNDGNPTLLRIKDEEENVLYEFYIYGGEYNAATHTNGAFETQYDKLLPLVSDIEKHYLYFDSTSIGQGVVDFYCFKFIDNYLRIDLENGDTFGYGCNHRLLFSGGNGIGNPSLELYEANVSSGGTVSFYNNSYYLTSLTDPSISDERVAILPNHTYFYGENLGISYPIEDGIYKIVLGSYLDLFRLDLQPNTNTPKNTWIFKYFIIEVGDYSSTSFAITIKEYDPIDDTVTLGHIIDTEPDRVTYRYNSSTGSSIPFKILVPSLIENGNTLSSYYHQVISDTTQYPGDYERFNARKLVLNNEENFRCSNIFGTNDSSVYLSYISKDYSNTSGYIDNFGFGLGYRAELTRIQTTPTPTPTPTPTQLYVSGTTASKTYDGTATASSSDIILGAVSGIASGDDVTVTVAPNTLVHGGVFQTSAGVSQSNAGSCYLPVTYTLSGVDAAKYIEPASEVVSATINKKTIELTNVYASDKEYDGSTMAEIGWQAVDGIYNNEVEVRATGYFDNKNYGTNKDVNVTFSVVDKVSNSGASSNYNEPSAEPVKASIWQATLNVTLPEVVFAGKPYDGSTLSYATVNNISLLPNTLTTITGFSGFSGFKNGEGASLKAGAEYDQTLAATAGSYGVTVTFSLTANNGTSLSNYNVVYSSQNPVSKTAVISQVPTVTPFAVRNLDNSRETRFRSKDANQEKFRVVCYSPSGSPVLRWDDGNSNAMNGFDEDYYYLQVTCAPRVSGTHTLAHKCEVYLKSDPTVSSCCYFINLSSCYYSGTYDGSNHDRLTTSLPVYLDASTTGTLSNITGFFERPDTSSSNWVASSGTTIKNVGAYTASEERNGTVTSNGTSYPAFIYAEGTATITPKTITPFNVTVEKVYDGSSTINNSSLTSPSTSVRSGHIQFQIGSYDIASGDIVTITASVINGFGSSDAGSYSITVNFACDSGNYSIGSVTVNNATIRKKDLTISGTVTAFKTYDKTSSSGGGTDRGIQITGTIQGIVGSDDVTVGAIPTTNDLRFYTTASGDTPQINAGSCYLPVTYIVNGAAANNYNAPDAERVSATINKREVGVNGTSVTKVYDGYNTAGTATLGTSLTDALSGDTVSTLGIAVASVGAYSGADVGSYEVAVTYTSSNSNYDVRPSNNVPATITQKPLTISASSPTTIADKAWDGNTIVTAVMGDVEGIVTVDGVVDDVSVIPIPSSLPSSDIGTYSGLYVDYELRGSKAGNYIEPPTTTNLTASVLSSEISVTCGIVSGAFSSSRYEKEYDGSGITLWSYIDGVRATASNYLGSNKTYSINWSLDGGKTYPTTAAYISASRFINQNVGSYKVICRLTHNENGSVFYSNEYDVVISRKQLGFVEGTSPSVVTKPYDTTLAAEITVPSNIIDGVVGSESVGVTGSGTFINASAGTNKDVYVTYALTGSTSVRANYYPPEPETLKGTIEQKEIKILSVSTANTNKTYDGNTNATIQYTTDTSTSIYNHEVSVLCISTFSDENAGVNKTVTLNFEVQEENHSGAASNYKINTTAYNIPSTVTATIAPKKLAVIGNTVRTSKVYDGSNSATVTALGTLDTGGVLSGDSGRVSLESASATYNNANAGSNKTITEVFTLSGPRSGNYTVDNKTFTGSIEKKQLTIMGTTVWSRDYNGTTTATIDIDHATISGKVNNQNVGVSPSGAFPSSNAGTWDVVVTYILTGDSSVIANYDPPASDTISATINKLSLTVPSPTVSFPGKDYDGEVLAPAVINTGVVSGFYGSEGGSLVATPTYSQELGADEGTYGVSVSYTLDFNDGTLSSNYQYSVPANASASAVISPRPITISGISSVNR